MGIRLFEHKSITIRFVEEGESLTTDELIVEKSKAALYNAIVSKPFNNNHCFHFIKSDQGFQLKADYYIGLDWLGDTGRYLCVEPKINTTSATWFSKQIEVEEEISKNDEVPDPLPIGLVELDYLKMLLQITTVPESASEIKDLIKIDWQAKPINIQQDEDKLTPFLVVRYLQLLKTIVRKGLKKDYYKVQENLNNKVKGKLLIGQHIKQNIFKNKFTSTYCEYQEFGEDHTENRFLKKVLQFASSYLACHHKLFGENYTTIQQTISYCRPAFELISNQVEEYELKHIKHNPFYKDYALAIDLGKQLLKRFAYTITQTTQTTIATPPFWIDMPRLFELYVYSKMIEANPNEKHKIHYQFATHGNALDILVSKSDCQMVIDAKYKLLYKNGHLHQDIRQVAGYARLNKIREKLKVTDDRNIDCVIIYPDTKDGIEDFNIGNIAFEMKKEENKISAYHKVYKLGIQLPLLNKKIL